MEAIWIEVTSLTTHITIAIKMSEQSTPTQHPLPVELDMLIVNHLFDEPDGMPAMDLVERAPESAGNNYPTLLSLCLVSWRFRVVVRPLLFRYLFIRRPVDLFHVLTSLMEDNGLQRAVRHITFIDSISEPFNVVWYHENIPALPYDETPSLGQQTAARLRQEIEWWRRTPPAIRDIETVCNWFDLCFFTVLCYSPELRTLDIAHSPLAPGMTDSVWRWIVEWGDEGEHVCVNLDTIRLLHSSSSDITRGLAPFYARPARRHTRLMLRRGQREMWWVTVGESPEGLRGMPAWAEEITVVDPLPGSLRFSSINPVNFGPGSIPPLLQSLVIRSARTSSTLPHALCVNQGTGWNYNSMMGILAPTLERLELDILVNEDTTYNLFGPSRRLRALHLLTHLRVLTITYQALFGSTDQLDHIVNPNNPAQIQAVIPASVEELTLIEWWVDFHDPDSFRRYGQTMWTLLQSRDLLDLLNVCRLQAVGPSFLHLRKVKMVGYLCKILPSDIQIISAVHRNVDHYHEKFAQAGIEFQFEESGDGESVSGV